MNTAFKACAILLASITFRASAQDTIGPYLYADFQSGFEGWKTILFLEGQAVFKGAPVTDPVVTLCGSVEMMGHSSLVEMRLLVREIGIDTTFFVDIPSGEFLGISISRGGDGVRRLDLVQSASPFGYD